MVTVVLIVGGLILLWIGVAQIFAAGEKSKASEVQGRAVQSAPGEYAAAPPLSSAYREPLIFGMAMVVVALLQWVCVVLVNKGVW